MPDAPRPTPSALLPGIGIAVGIAVADQASKWLAFSGLEPYEPVSLLPFLNLTLAFNPGAAFSLLADSGGWQRWLFIGLAVAISGYLLVWLRGVPRSDRIQMAGLGGILGGAIGNLIDRVHLGVVIDFIDVHYGGWHWPAFNFADAAITVGVATILFSVLRDSRSCKK